MEDKHLNLRIYGKVQGVWYRGSARNKALELGLRGFVRNEPDGSVYCEVEGPADRLERFVAWCKQGPPLAVVTEVDVEEGEWEGFQTFSIRR